MTGRYVLLAGALVALALPATADAQAKVTRGRVKHETFIWLREHSAFGRAYDAGRARGPYIRSCGSRRGVVSCTFGAYVREGGLTDGYGGTSDCRFVRRRGSLRPSCRVYVAPSAARAVPTDIQVAAAVPSGRVKREAFVMLRHHGWLESLYTRGSVRGPTFTGCNQESHRLRPAVQCSFYLLLRTVRSRGYRNGYVHAYEGTASCRYFYRDDGTRQADGSLPVWRSCRVRMAPASLD